MYDKPDARGHFGPYGGIFVSETLMFALEELIAVRNEFGNARRSVIEVNAEELQTEDLIKSLGNT